MNELKELVPLVELLYSCWIISGDEAPHKEAIPTGPGVLDYGLRAALKEGAFPPTLQEKLHFVSTDTGLCCLELPYIQRIATSLKITSNPNPSYTRTEIIVGKSLARRCLADLKIAENDAVEWGKILRRNVQKAEEELSIGQA